MAPDTTTPRPRRAVLAAAFGGLAATVATALARPERALATNGDPIILGLSPTGTLDGTGVNEASTTTEIYTTSGVGLLAASASGAGLAGYSDSAGVYGQSFPGNGVFGRSYSAAASGVYGFNDHYGYAVAGRSNAGPLVSGAGAAATLGDNLANGIGVWARSAHGIGLFADAVNADAVALQTSGRVKFSRSGKVSVAAGKSYVDVTPPGGLSGTPLPFANLLTYRSGIFVAAIRPNYPTTGVMRIYLNKVASSSYSTPVSWCVLG